VTDAGGGRGLIRGRTRVAGIIGAPVEHSRSPAIWNAGFAAASLDWVFVALPVPEGQTAAALDGMRALGIAGLAVTMPHKTAAARGCDELSETAARLDAVNAVLARDGRLLGDSTDGEGFVRSLREERGDPSGQQVLVLGAGGAGRAITLALGDAGAHVTVAARRLDAAQHAAALAPGGVAAAMDAVQDLVAGADVVVNATPLGMSGEGPPFDPDLLRPEQLVYDTVYHPAETPLLAAARARGVPSVNGLGMLVHQAAVSFERFTGVAAPLDAMRHGAELA
jgi:shikimate dehydrogenase